MIPTENIKKKELICLIGLSDKMTSNIIIKNKNVTKRSLLKTKNDFIQTW